MTVLAPPGEPPTPPPHEATPLSRPQLDRVLAKPGALGLLRSKILALGLAAALLPTLIVGVAAFLAARGFLAQKVDIELNREHQRVARLIDSWLQSRLDETETYARDSLPGHVERWVRAASEERQAFGRIIEDYLTQLRRYSGSEVELLCLRDDGSVLAGTTRPGDAFPAADILTAGTLLFYDSGLGNSWAAVSHPIVPRLQPDDDSSDLSSLGTLVSLHPLGDLWRQDGLTLAYGRLRVFDPNGFLLFDDAPVAVPKQYPSAADRARQVTGPTVATYKSLNNVEVLGAFGPLLSSGASIFVELEVGEAFSDIQRLRSTLLAILLAAVGFVTLAVFAVVRTVSRPIEALTSGVEKVSQGQLDLEIPVTSRDEIGYLTRVFNQMTRSLRDSYDKLEKLSATDELTGLHNRRELFATFYRELERARRNGEPLAVLMIDIDHFKSFNDRFGHAHGDQILRLVSSLLQGSLRPADTLARYGGEEFTALLPDTAREQARMAAERLRRTCANSDLVVGSDSKITISIGVASYPGDGDHEEALILVADRNLYEAKNRGRNQVICSGD